MIIAPQERLAVTPDLYQKYNVSIPNHVYFYYPDAFATGEKNQLAAAHLVVEASNGSWEENFLCLSSDRPLFEMGKRRNRANYLKFSQTGGYRTC